MNTKREDIIAIIVSKAEEVGATLAELSKAAGKNHAYLQQFVKRGTPRHLPENVREAIAERLNLSENELKEGASPHPPSGTISPNSAPQLPPSVAMLADIPVLGSAAGSLGEGAFQLDAGAIDYVKRPPGVAQATDIYALYVVGESMLPRYEEGELLYVSERKPPRLGDHVVVQVQNDEHDDVRAYVKKLIRRGLDVLTLEQYNPPAAIEIPIKNVKSVHKILTMNDLFGV